MKQTFEIPKGCNRVTIEQQGNKIVTTFEPEFKEGDVLFVEENMPYLSTVFIFKKYIESRRSEVYAANVGGKLVYFEGSVTGLPRHATEPEKQQLFNAIAKEGKQWNAEKKCIEDLNPKRWRAEYGHHYWHFDYRFKALQDVEQGTKLDSIRYNCGNYFKTESDTEAAAEETKELLKQINP